VYNVTTFLDLQRGLRAQLWVHLLQNDVEQVAIVFAAVDAQADAIVFRTKEVYLATPDDFEIHSGYHIELTDEARARIIKQAWDTGTTPVEFHSHPGDAGDLWPAMFSASDMYGFSDYVPHCRWRLRGRPYLAVVVSNNGFDALVWAGTDNEPAALYAIREPGSAPIMPTNRSIDSLKNGEATQWTLNDSTASCSFSAKPGSGRSPTPT
jgi:hypothetical protein